MRVIGECIEVDKVVASVADSMGAGPWKKKRKEAAKPRGLASGATAVKWQFSETGAAKRAAGRKGSSDHNWANALGPAARSSARPDVLASWPGTKQTSLAGVNLAEPRRSANMPAPTCLAHAFDACPRRRKREGPHDRLCVCFASFGLGRGSCVCLLAEAGVRVGTLEQTQSS